MRLMSILVALMIPSVSGHAAATFAPSPVVIAHRGAPGYLPENSLEGFAYAHALGADDLEFDVVLTKDDEAIVLHGLWLEEVKDVLRLQGRRHPATGQLAHAGRFAPGGFPFVTPTLDETLQLIRGLNDSAGRAAGVYVEVKSPHWRRAKGRDPSPRILGILARIRSGLRSDLKLAQIIGENDWGGFTTDSDWSRPRTIAGSTGTPTRCAATTCRRESHPRACSLTCCFGSRASTAYSRTSATERLCC